MFWQSMFDEMLDRNGARSGIAVSFRIIRTDIKTSRGAFPGRLNSIMESKAVFCLANQKGGVGKTTTAIHLAACLAKKNRVLLIDLDAQSNASSIFLENDCPVELSVHAVFREKKTAAELAQKTRNPNLDLLPAVMNLAEVETLLAGAVDGFFRLNDALKSSSHDYIVIDCPPNLGMLTVNAFVCSTHLIVPLQTSKFSLDGLRGILETTNTIQKRFNPKIRIQGALLTMFNGRTGIAQALGGPIAEFLHVFETKISQSVVVEEAHLMHKTLFEYNPRSKPAKQYEAFTAEVLNGL